jgi:hypothetical protein
MMKTSMWSRVKNPTTPSKVLVIVKTDAAGDYSGCRGSGASVATQQFLVIAKIDDLGEQSLFP